MKSKMLSDSSMKLLLKINPKQLAISLGKQISYSKKPDTLLFAIKLVDVSGLDRFTVAVFGSALTARRLGFSDSIISAFVENDISIGQNGILTVNGFVHLKSITGLPFPIIDKISRSLKLSRCKNISFTSLGSVGGFVDLAYSHLIDFPI